MILADFFATWIRIRRAKMKQIQRDPDPQNCYQLLLKMVLLLVRLELTTPAYLCTVYKYRALTDCATGAD